jgi:hypothetical protein
MILSGVAILVILVAMNVALNTVKAMPIGVPPVDAAPQVYLLKKTFDICDQYLNGLGPSDGGLSENAPLPGGSVPPSGITGEGQVQSGCVDFIGDRANEYLFSGEQMAILVAVRDLNGAEDITKADLYVDGVERVKCNLIDPTVLQQGPLPGQDCEKNVSACWYGHDVSADLAQQPPAYAAMTKNGFDDHFDKLYQCVFTATPADTSGETGSIVVVKAFDQVENTGISVPDNVWLNPAITLDIWTEPGDTVTFPAGTPGQTVYSESTLKIKNTADGGVDLVTWLAGTDLFASDGAAKCPDSNIIDVEKYMQYRCKIGTYFNNPWTNVPNPNDKLDCDLDGCQGSSPLLPTLLQSDHIPSILANQHTAECWFRFTYPTPICVGDFANGGEIIIYARAI